MKCHKLFAYQAKGSVVNPFLVNLFRHAFPIFVPFAKETIYDFYDCLG